MRDRFAATIGKSHSRAEVANGRCEHIHDLRGLRRRKPAGDASHFAAGALNFGLRTLIRVKCGFGPLPPVALRESNGMRDADSVTDPIEHQGRRDVSR
jgi:hypothetical protein